MKEEQEKKEVSIADTVVFIIHLYRYANTNLLFNTTERWMIPNEINKQRNRKKNGGQYC
jgi:hypothetical protein